MLNVADQLFWEASHLVRSLDALPLGETGCQSEDVCCVCELSFKATLVSMHKDGSRLLPKMIVEDAVESLGEANEEEKKQKKTVRGGKWETHTDKHRASVGPQATSLVT